MSLPGTRRKSLMRDINVVPYIDVMLVLLVIFMTTVPLLDQSVEISLPQGESAPLKSDNIPPFVLFVDADGLYYLDGEEIDAERIQAEARNAQASETPPRFQIRGDAEARYQFVIDAIVLLTQEGVQNIDLVNQPPR